MCDVFFLFVRRFSWWPFFVVLFYIASPLPVLWSRRYADLGGSSNACYELAIFITTGIVISAFGLPIVLARTPVPVVSSIFLFVKNEAACMKSQISNRVPSPLLDNLCMKSQISNRVLSSLLDNLGVLRSRLGSERRHVSHHRRFLRRFQLRRPQLLHVVDVVRIHP
jgi:hypothetical protein